MGIIEPALYWLIIGVMLFFLEMAVPGFILFFFGLGAFVTALVAWLSPISIAWQLALFIVTSLVALWALRDIIQKKFHAPRAEGEEEEEEDEDVTVPIVGEKGVVSMTIVPPAEGQVKYSGTFWRATADEEIEAGEIIAVVSRKGIVIHVEKV